MSASPSAPGMIGAQAGLRLGHLPDRRRPDPRTPPPARCSKARHRTGCGTGSPTRSPPHGFELRLVSSAAAIGGANGLTDFLTREVSVRMDMDDAAQVKTLAHELGHVMLHGPDTHVDGRRDCTAGSPRSKPSRSRSWSAPRTGSTPTPTRSRTSSTWASERAGQDPGRGRPVDRRTRPRAPRSTILDKLDTRQVGDGNPPGLDREALAAGPGTAPVPAGRTDARGECSGYEHAQRRRAVPTRRPRHAQVPVVMPLVEVAVDDDGFLTSARPRAVLPPTGCDSRRPRSCRRRRSPPTSAHPVRVEVREADGIDVHRHRHSPDAPAPAAAEPCSRPRIRRRRR